MSSFYTLGSFIRSGVIRSDFICWEALYVGKLYTFWCYTLKRYTLRRYTLRRYTLRRYTLSIYMFVIRSDIIRSVIICSVGESNLTVQLCISIWPPGLGLRSWKHSVVSSAPGEAPPASGTALLFVPAALSNPGEVFRESGGAVLELL
jgi:hypothetical protein